MWYVTNQKLVRSACNAFLAWAVMADAPTALAAQVAARHGEVWRDLLGKTRSRWTKPMWAAGETGRRWANRRRPSRSSRLRRKCGAHGRIRMSRVARSRARSLILFDPNNRGAWRDRPNRWLALAYSGLANQGYDHFSSRDVNMSASGEPGPHRHATKCIAWPTTRLHRWWLGIRRVVPSMPTRPTISTSSLSSIAAVRRLVKPAFLPMPSQAAERRLVPYKGLVGGQSRSQTQMSGIQERSRRSTGQADGVDVISSRATLWRRPYGNAPTASGMPK